MSHQDKIKPVLGKGRLKFPEPSCMVHERECSKKCAISRWQENEPPLACRLKCKTAAARQVLRAAGGGVGSKSDYVWTILGVMKKISSWLDVVTERRLNKLPRYGMSPSRGTC